MLAKPALADTTARVPLSVTPETVRVALPIVPLTRTVWPEGMVPVRMETPVVPNEPVPALSARVALLSATGLPDSVPPD